MSASPTVEPSDESVTRGEVARGAGLVGLSRASALIEVVAQPLFIWLFGLPTYGIYVALWASINFVENIVDLSLTSALQRIVPTEDDERAHASVKAALLVTVLPAAAIALLVTLNAGWVASFFHAAPADTATLPTAVALFAWGLPLWTFIEIATSAARARRAFGPEIRLRLFWEQIARIAFALGFFGLGAGNLGLVLAHLGSLSPDRLAVPAPARPLLRAEAAASRPGRRRRPQAPADHRPRSAPRQCRAPIPRRRARGDHQLPPARDPRRGREPACSRSPASSPPCRSPSARPSNM